MNEILKKQIKLQEGYIDDPSHICNLRVGSIYDYIQMMQTHMNMEITELLSSLSADNMKIHKPWSTSYEELRLKYPADPEHTAEEAIDAMCFMMNIMIAAGVTPDNIAGLYQKVYDKNIARQYDQNY
jgi:hypothetical protein